MAYVHVPAVALSWRGITDVVHCHHPSGASGLRIRNGMKPIATASIVFALGTSLAAQWLKQPTAGIPRTADGKPSLSAEGPRTSDGRPDLSGLWLMNTPVGYVGNIAADLETGDVQPWAGALYKQRMEDLGKDDPGTIGCLPLGPRHIIGIGMAKIIQSRNLLAVLYEDLTYRQIFLDGRELPKDPNPSWMGYSVGHWEGDTLIVESLGFNDRTWLDSGGHPHTEALRMTERIRRLDFGHMSVQVMIDDAKAYAKPWSIAMAMNLAADTELIEYVCAESIRDRAHLVGRTPEEKRVHVASDILAKYIGDYATSSPNSNLPISVFTVTLVGDQLFIDFDGRGKLPLIPLSATIFSLFGSYEFVVNDRGVVTHLVWHTAERDTKAVRRSESAPVRNR
jgi:hypothetical protein